MRKPLICLALAAGMMLSSGLTQASDYRESIDGAPSAGAMTFDMLIVRPLSLVATVVGAVVFIVQAPISAFQEDGLNTTGNKLVVEPAKFTFTRPMGALE